MTPDEAIEKLKKYHDQAACKFDAESAFAFQLGIEALERIRKIREVPYIDWLQSMSEIRRVLPSETEGDK